MALHQVPLCERQLVRRVDADDLLAQLPAVQGNFAPVPAQDLRHIGEVVLVLGVVVGEPVQRARQQPSVKAVDAHIELADLLLFRRAVLILDDPDKCFRGVPQDAAIGQRQLGGAGEEGTGRLRLAVVIQKALVDLTAQQRHVAVADEHRAVEAIQKRPGAEYGVAGAHLGLLHRRRIAGKGVQNLLPLVAHHQQCVLPGDKVQRREHIVQQGLSARRAEHLGQIALLGLHPGALAGCQYNRFYLVHSPSSFPSWVMTRTNASAASRRMRP